jgi:1,4-alpha-glucan branching enzyme
MQTVHFEFADPTAQKVCLAGTFNHWRPEAGEMHRLTNGKWSKDIDLAPGTYEYRLVVDDRWIPDPNADHAVTNPFGEANSLLTVPR